MISYPDWNKGDDRQDSYTREQIMNKKILRWTIIPLKYYRRDFKIKLQ